MRTEELLRQAERNEDIQAQVRIHLRILNREAAKRVLAKANVIDWFIDERLPNSHGHRTCYRCPHCFTASEYQVSKTLLQCPSCLNYYLDSAMLSSFTQSITP